MSKINSVVVVTGASSGIGQAFAEQLHSQGYAVMLVARREERLLALQKQLEIKRSNSTIVKVCDLSQRESVKQLALELQNLDIVGLVNNAGVGSLGAFKNLDFESELSQIEVNVIAPLILSRAVVGSMCKRGSGFIINVSSIMAYQAVPYVATYAASKSFEWRHSVALRNEVSKHGVKVLTLCPGPTETEFFGIAKIPGGITRFKRADPLTVVSQCLRDLEKGRTVSIPTFLAKLLVLAAILIPTPIYTWFVVRILEPVMREQSMG